VVELTVLGPAGEPVSGVNLEVIPPRGPPRTLTTDSAGRALVPALAPGVVRVRARRIGYRPGEIAVALDAGRNTVPIVLDVVQPPLLAAVRVMGDREVLARHQEFETRRRLGQTTASITADDIEKRNPVATWQMLSDVRAIAINELAGAVYAASTRGSRLNKRGVPKPCYYRLMVDGVEQRPTSTDLAPDLSNLPPPSEVHGIEVFAGPATMPPQYNSVNGGGGSPLAADATNICGLIAVWTK